MVKFSVIITAGGLGKRMGEELPKQFLLAGGKPILIHTLELFHKYDPDAQFLITLPNEWKSYWEKLCIQYNCNIVHQVIDGGQERYFSIKNALSFCEGEFIAVHDGVRPLVSLDTIKRCFDEVKIKGQVIPVYNIKESIRQLFDDTSKAVDRSQYCIVQTPQCFKAEVLIDAYNRDYHDSITDDASLVEEAGYQIHLVEGNVENVKITSPIDLILANCLL